LPQKNSVLGCGWRYWAFRLTPCSPPQQHWRWLGLRRLDTAKCGTHSWRSTSSPSPFQALRGRWVAQCDGSSLESCSKCSCCGSCLHASQLPVSQPVCLSQESVCEHVSVCACERMWFDSCTAGNDVIENFLATEERGGSNGTGGQLSRSCQQTQQPRADTDTRRES
jgi:hypothetical protein